MNKILSKVTDSAFLLTLTKFLFVGVLNTIVGIGLYYLFLEILKFPWPFALPISHIIATVHSYIWNKYFTFKSNEKSIKEVIKFIIVSATQLLFTYIFNFIFIEVFKMPEFLSGVLTILIVTFLSFFGHLSFSFSSSNKQEITSNKSSTPKWLKEFINNNPKLWNKILTLTIYFLAILGHLIIILLSCYLYNNFLFNESILNTLLKPKNISDIPSFIIILSSGLGFICAFIFTYIYSTAFIIEKEKQNYYRDVKIAFKSFLRYGLAILLSSLIIYWLYYYLKLNYLITFLIIIAISYLLIIIMRQKYKLNR